jgi:hypothetical protein
MVREAETPYRSPAGDPRPWHDTIQWVRLRNDARIGNGPILFWGMILGDQGGSTRDVDLYHGFDAGGDPFVNLRINTAVSTGALMLPKPVYFPRGLFVDFAASNQHDVTFFYEDVPQ